MAGPGGKPTLVIPMEFDGAEAIKMLEKLAEAGKGAGDEIEDAAGKSRTLGQQVAAVISTQGYQMLKDGAQALAQGYKETADYIKQISAEYVTLRETLQQVAALKGVSNSGDFTVKQARAAEAASLKPEEWAKFQEQFQSYAGAYLEGDQKKMSGADAESFQKQLAQFSKARGLPADQAAQLGGGVLQFAAGAIGADEAMKRFGRSFKTLERAPTPVNQLLPQMTRVMAQGANSDEAAQLLALSSEFAPGEEETSVTNTLKAINHAILKGKGAELGVTDEMTPLAKIKAATGKLDAREAKGENLNAMIAEYFPDIRETRGARGFLNRGFRAGGFGRVAGYVNDTPDDFTKTAVADYERSDAGKHARMAAGLAAARVERGDLYKDVEMAKLEAEKQLTRSGRFDEMELGDTFRTVLSSMSVGYIPGKREQLINETAVSTAFQRAVASGALTEKDVLNLGQIGQTGMGMTELGVNDAILGLLKKRNELAERQARKPLAAPPAAPVVRPT